MRLLNTDTLALEFFQGNLVPQYAILSHTWGNDELLFDDVRLGPEQIPTTKEGFPKVRDSCALAKREGHAYIWIDTCCIDKSSSAELSEAINSMFVWYQRATVCYAYLTDVSNASSWPASRWFTRGWTLQELIAPGRVVFYNREWVELGDRLSMAKGLAGRTKIDLTLLSRANTAPLKALLEEISVATRLSWASGRHTTRLEDRAYSLLGLFDIHMPLLYGEGTKAFGRLQEEIIKNTHDQSIICHSLGINSIPLPGGGRPDRTRSNLHDSGPSTITLDLDSFAQSGGLTRLPPFSRNMALNAGGLELDVFLSPRIDEHALISMASGSWPAPLRIKPSTAEYHHTRLALLDCGFQSSQLSRVGIFIAGYTEPLHQGPDLFYRTCWPVMRVEPLRAEPDGAEGTIFILWPVFVYVGPYGPVSLDFRVTFSTTDFEMNRVLLRDYTPERARFGHFIPELDLDIGELHGYRIVASMPVERVHMIGSVGIPHHRRFHGFRLVKVNGRRYGIYGYILMESMPGHVHDRFSITWSAGQVDDSGSAPNFPPWCVIKEVEAGITTEQWKDSVAGDRSASYYIPEGPFTDESPGLKTSLRPTSYEIRVQVKTRVFFGRWRVDMGIKSEWRY